MSTETHDEMITKAVRWAKSLGYDVVEYHLGTDTGADAIFQNQFGEKVILEVVTGANFRNLFQKPRIKEALSKRGLSTTYTEPRSSDILALIIVGDRIDHVKQHGIEAGLPKILFDPPKHKIYPLLALDFDKVIPILLVSILGTRASAYARWA